jgi:predicted protein tyrosine phosphatase
LSSSSPFVPFDITVCGVEELHGHREAGVTHVLSLLDPGWPTPEAFSIFGEHRRLDLRFHDVIEELPDQQAPTEEDVAKLLAFGRELPPHDAHLLVHCHMGISRSSAAMTLLLAQARPDQPAAAALAEVVRIRPHAWPNLRLMEFGDAQLQRGGELVAAARERYRFVVAKRPQLGQTMIELGRSREVDSAELIA